MRWARWYHPAQYLTASSMPAGQRGKVPKMRLEVPILKQVSRSWKARGVPFLSPFHPVPFPKLPKQPTFFGVRDNRGNRLDASTRVRNISLLSYWCSICDFPPTLSGGVPSRWKCTKRRPLRGALPMSHVTHCGWGGAAGGGGGSALLGQDALFTMF